MKRLSFAVLLGVSALVSNALSAQAPIKAALSLPHDHVLPGVPFDMVIRYTNVSDRPLTIAGTLATLVVTYESGVTSVLHRAEANDQNTIEPSVPLVLLPGKSTDQAVSWEAGAIPAWFRYASIAGPGTYGLALDLKISDDDLNLISSVRTTKATLTRINPVGVDAALWSRMQQISEGRWASNWFQAADVGLKLADEIVQLYPASEYYPYALAVTATWPWRKPLPILLEAASRFPSSPAYPYLLLAAADAAWGEAVKAERKRDVAEAQRFAQLAATSYRQALATKNIGVQDKVTDGLWRTARILERASKKAR